MSVKIDSNNSFFEKWKKKNNISTIAPNGNNNFQEAKIDTDNSFFEEWKKTRPLDTNLPTTANPSGGNSYVKLPGAMDIADTIIKAQQNKKAQDPYSNYKAPSNSVSVPKAVDKYVNESKSTTSPENFPDPSEIIYTNDKKDDYIKLPTTKETADKVLSAKAYHDNNQLYYKTVNETKDKNTLTREQYNRDLNVSSQYDSYEDYLYAKRLKYWGSVSKGNSNYGKVKGEYTQFKVQREDENAYLDYLKVMQNDDFEENSKYIPGSVARSKMYSDPYDYINGDEEASKIANKAKTVDIHQEKSATWEESYSNLSDQTKKVYNYIHNTQGQEEADKFLELAAPRKLNNSEVVSIGGRSGLAGLYYGITGDEEGYARELQAQQRAKETNPVSYMAGELFMTTMMFKGIGAAVGKASTAINAAKYGTTVAKYDPVFGQLFGGASKTISYTSKFVSNQIKLAGTMMTMTAAQNLAPARFGYITPGKYALSIGTSGVASIAGSVAGELTRTGIGNALIKSGLDTPFMRYAGAVASSAAFAGTRTGVEAIGGNVNKDNLTESLLVGFAFSLVGGLEQTYNELENAEKGLNQIKGLTGSKYKRMANNLSMYWDNMTETEKAQAIDDILIELYQDSLAIKNAKLPGQQANIQEYVSGIDKTIKAFELMSDYYSGNIVDTEGTEATYKYLSDGISTNVMDGLSSSGIEIVEDTPKTVGAIESMSPNVVQDATSDVLPTQSDNGTITNIVPTSMPENAKYNLEDLKVGPIGIENYDEAYDGRNKEQYLIDYVEAYHEGREASNLPLNVADSIVAEEYSGKTDLPLKIAFYAGIEDGRNIAQELQNIENGELTNEGEISLREGGEWNDGINSGEQISAVEEGPGRNAQNWEIDGRQELREATEGSTRVTARQANIPGGTDTNVIELLNDSAPEARALSEYAKAELPGINKVVAFKGNNLSIAKNDYEYKDVRAMIDVGTGIAYVRTDAGVSAKQLLLHEHTHVRIANGEIDVDSVYKSAINKLGKDKVDNAVKAYASAYYGMTVEVAKEEIVCDAVAEINIFKSGVAKNEEHSKIFGAVKEAVDNTDTRGPPKFMEAEESEDDLPVVEFNRSAAVERFLLNYSGKVETTLETAWIEAVPDEVEIVSHAIKDGCADINIVSDFGTVNTAFYQYMFNISGNDITIVDIIDLEELEEKNARIEGNINDNNRGKDYRRSSFERNNKNGDETDNLFVKERKPNTRNAILDGEESESNRRSNGNEGERNSLSKSKQVDSEGNTLTKEQTEYFKDSKVRDDNGNLLVVYHGTDAEFTVFDKEKGRANMDIQGSFFSPWEIDAGGYGKNVKAYYLNITNPASENEGYKVLNMYKGKNNAGILAREYLVNRGYDGVNNGGEEYIAFYPDQIKLVDNTTPTNNPDIRMSRENDAEYLSLAKDPEKNKVRLQEMVNEAARIAMPNTKVIDEKGYPRVVYHQSEEPFNVFRKGTKNGLSGRGIYFSYYGERFGKGSVVRPFFVNVENPITKEVLYERENELQEPHISGKYVRYDGQIRQTALEDFPEYDGVMIRNDELVVKDPSQVKSADPVTYDDDGNIIPLSKRFNPEENDIRFSKEITKDGERYVRLNGERFKKEDGTPMTPKEAYNSLVGEEITLPDGDKITFIKNINGKDIYDELIKRYPSHSENIDLKPLNNKINDNIVDILEISKKTISDEEDKKRKHEKLGIVAFDTREAIIADDSNAYKFFLSIATLNTGEKFAYAKKFIRIDRDFWKKIEAETAGTIPPESASIRTIPQPFQKSNNKIKTSRENFSDSTDELYNTISELNSELKKLKQKVRSEVKRAEYWEGETRLTPKSAVDQKQVKVLDKDLITGTTLNKGDFVDDINELAKLVRSGDSSLTSAWEKARQIVIKKTKNLDTIDKEWETERKDNLNKLKSKTKIYVDETQKDFFRKGGPGKKLFAHGIYITFTPGEGISINKKWSDWESMLPGWIPPIEEVGSNGDLLNHIVELVDIFTTPQHEAIYNLDSNDEYITAESAALIKSVMDLDSPSPTRADKLKEKIQKQSEISKQKLVERYEEKLQRTKDHYKEITANKRQRRVDGETRTKLLNLVRRVKRLKTDSVTKAYINEIIGDIDTVAKSMK